MIADILANAPLGITTLTRGTRVIERPGWYQVISPNSKSTARNEVIRSRLSADEAPAVIDRTIAEYMAVAAPFKWCTYPDTTPENFGGMLEKKGFGSWAARGMYFSLSGIQWRSLPPTVTVEPVDAKNLEDYCDAFLMGWILDRPSDERDRSEVREDLEWIANRFGDRTRFYLARVDGVPAGTAGYYQRSNCAYLVGGNVLKQFRGNGIYRALLDARFSAIRSVGIDLVVTGAREDTSAPILEKLGFSTAYRNRIYQFGGTLPE